MKMFHIQAADQMGDSLDWFAKADTPDEAKQLWETELPGWGFDTSEGITRIREILPTCAGTQWELGPARLILWEDLPVVFEP